MFDALLALQGGDKEMRHRDRDRDKDITLVYKRQRIRLLGKAQGLTRDYRFEGSKPVSVNKKDAIIILEKCADEFTTA